MFSTINTSTALPSLANTSLYTSNTSNITNQTLIDVTNHLNAAVNNSNIWRTNNIISSNNSTNTNNTNNTTINTSNNLTHINIPTTMAVAATSHGGRINNANSIISITNNLITATPIMTSIPTTMASRKTGAERLFAYLECDGSDPEDYAR
jgi:hypothetical protein